MIYVIPQFLLIAACLWVANFHALSLFSLCLMVIALLLGVWAVICMRPGHFNVRPHPQENAVLVSHGPYGLIRHPMYTSVLLMCLGLVLSSDYVWAIFLWLLLAVVLFLKLQFEEKLLQSRLPEYQPYMQKTKRLFPYIF